MARTALFVIDVQVSLARNALTEIPHAARIRDAGTQVLERARQSIDAATGVPDLEIVFVQHEEGTDVGDLVRGSEAWELVFKPREENKWERLVGKDVRK
jgi:nicotinamidase-related amidase